MYKIGFSKDTHLIEKINNGKILCGNYEISCDYKIIANSDGDVLLHSLSESILGALGLNDIGYYFKNINNNIKSLDIILFAIKKLDIAKYKIENIDLLIENNEIKLCQYREKIIKSISNILSIEKNNIGLKFTTNENSVKNVFICYSNILISKK